jgi:signal peptidase I
MCRILKISGNSLLPEYQDGDYVIASKVSLRLKRPISGDVVVFRIPEYGILIKRVDHVLPGGEQVFVLGTDPLSTDSRLFGPVQVHNLDGRVIYHIHRQKTA